MGELTEDEHAVLEIESRLWTRTALKEEEVRMRFEWTLTGYHQVLNALIDREEALAAYPVTVNRLRRAREAKRLGRA